jgi:hypothetical protein
MRILQLSAEADWERPIYYINPVRPQMKYPIKGLPIKELTGEEELKEGRRAVH